MPSIPWRRVLQVLAVTFVLISIAMSIAWYIHDPGFDPTIALLWGITGVIMGIGSSLAPTGKLQQSITGNNNVQQSTKSGNIVNAPNSEVDAGANATKGQRIESPNPQKAQHITHKIQTLTDDSAGRDQVARQSIIGNNNVQQSTQSGHIVNAPNSKIAAGGDVYINKWIEAFHIQEMQQIPHEIPPPPADFTGRDKELQDLLNHFDQGVTITGLRGMGGIGKSALAFELAKKLADRYPDGQIFVELKGMDPEGKHLTPAEAMAHVIRAYNPDVRLPENESVLNAAYRTTLHGKRSLMLLDNAAGDQQIMPLLPLPDSCGVIVTSRQNIAFQGLIPIDLNVLKPDKAIELLLKIRRPDQPIIALTQEREDLGEIAKLCGYLPLALRAAGSFLANRPDISLDQYNKELSDERTRLEKIGKEGTGLYVDASFNLSYNHLPITTAQVFRMLSIFPADFDANAEEFVCEDEGHRQLSELVRWNLVEFQCLVESQEVTGRYRMHDLIHIFSATYLEERDGENTRRAIERRHAQYYMGVLSIAHNFYLQDRKSVMIGLWIFDLERMNIQAGQRWVEGMAALQVDQAKIGKRTPDEEFILRLANSYPKAGTYILALRLHPREMIHWLEIALDAARQLNDISSEGAHLGNLGIAYKNLGEYHKAIEYIEKDIAIAREIGDRGGEGQALGNLGNVHYNLGEYQKAIEFQEKYLAIAKEIGDRRSEGLALSGLGNAYFSLGEYSKAVEFQEKCIAIAKEIGDRRNEGVSLANLGIIYRNIGEYHKAIEFLEKALDIAKEIGFRMGEGQALGNLGNAYYNLGDYSKAIEFQEKRLAIAREIEDPKGEGNALWNMSLALDEIGERAQAIDYAKLALNIFELIECPDAGEVRQLLEEWSN